MITRSLLTIVFLLVAFPLAFLVHRRLNYVNPESRCFTFAPRDRYCVYNNVCINPRYGVFVLGNHPRQEVPWVNMGAADKEADRWILPLFAPPSLVFRDVKPLWLNRTLLFGHGYSLEHMTHRLVNGLLPAVDMIRHLQMQNEIALPWEFDLILEERAQGELQEPLSWDFETVHLGDPKAFPLLEQHTLICYPHAVFGLNNTCPFPYCEHQHEKELYAHVRELVWSQCHLGTPAGEEEEEAAAAETGTAPRSPQIHVIQRRKTRRILGMEKLVEVLERHGTVATFELEEMGFCEQTKVFYDADVVLAMHGNSMGHMLWMRENSTIIELSAKGWSSPFFRGILRGLKSNLGYRFVGCQSDSCAVAEELAPKPAGLSPKNRNLVIDQELAREIDSYLKGWLAAEAQPVLTTGGEDL